MPSKKVRFTYYTGIKCDIFEQAILRGNWDATGTLSHGPWSEKPLEKAIGEDGCPIFFTEMFLDDRESSNPFRWGVGLKRRDGGEQWGIFAEVHDRHVNDRYRAFKLSPYKRGEIQHETYHLSYHHWLGAQKYYPNLDNPNDLRIRFAVWAPNAKNVEVVFGQESGYIADDGTGLDPDRPPLPMTRLADGIWEVIRPDYADYVGLFYMFRIERGGDEDGQVVYRTDLYSRSQAGKGTFDPDGAPYTGAPDDLDGTRSCSVVVDPDLIPSNGSTLSLKEFWVDEFTPNRALPQRLEDLVIYELNVGALGYGRETPGLFEDAVNFLPYLQDLGVNCVALLPLSEFTAPQTWGQGTSHPLTAETSSGGREALMQFVKACHRRGIAVIMDVICNRYAFDTERVQWQYDSTSHQRNIYYWYEGQEGDYPEWSGGYVDNGSFGWAPRYHERHARHLFIDRAAMLMDECHIDGFRVKQVTSIHAGNTRHADGEAVDDANIFGIKFLREYCATLQALKPNVILAAEDYSTWDRVTQPMTKGGLGFDAKIYSDFYHHLVGDAEASTNYAKLLYQAGRDPKGPLAMSFFAGALYVSPFKKIVYHESHDEASRTRKPYRTIQVAVNGADLTDSLKEYAEARSRFVAGMSLLSAGTPLFLMGEEVGASQPYNVGDFTEHKEDLLGLREKEGGRLFHFYADLISLRLNNSAFRSPRLTTIHATNPARVIAFRRWDETQEFLVVGSLNNAPFSEADYNLGSDSLEGTAWREIFNSDAAKYGGAGVGNGNDTLQAPEGRLSLSIPANGFIVLEYVGGRE